MADNKALVIDVKQGAELQGLPSKWEDFTSNWK